MRVAQARLIMILCGTAIWYETIVSPWAIAAKPAKLIEMWLRQLTVRIFAQVATPRSFERRFNQIIFGSVAAYTFGHCLSSVEQDNRTRAGLSSNGFRRKQHKEG